MDDRERSGRSLGLLGGGALVLLGGWFLLRATGIISTRVAEVLGRVSLPLGIIFVGVILLAVSARGGLSIRGPVPGSRLYRSRDDRWAEGVLGGLAKYLGVDALVLRLAFIGLMLVGAWALVPAYIVMAIVVPKEPQ
jgi:phage shock protein C